MEKKLVQCDLVFTGEGRLESGCFFPTVFIDNGLYLLLQYEERYLEKLNQTKAGMVLYSVRLKKGEFFINIFGVSIYIWIAVFVVMSLGSVLLAIRLLKDLTKK